MKSFSFRLVLFLYLMFFLPVLIAQNQRVRYNFNSDWKLMVGDVPGCEIPETDDASWKKITLPHAFNEDEAFKLHIEDLTDTIVWYRKTFRLPDSDKGKKVLIEFEGVRFGAEVFVNGSKAGMHENGVMAFGLDITGLVHYEKDNVIAVRVDNSWSYREKSTNSTFQWNNKNFNANYGGIPKNVFLHVMGEVYQTLPLYSNLKTTGTYIYASDFEIKNKKAVIHAESEVHNASGKSQQVGFEVVIKDMHQQEIARFSGLPVNIEAGATGMVKAFAPVEKLNFWSWGYGYLYDVATILRINGNAVDVVETRTGFRKTAFKDGMIYLNDRVIQMKGYAQRTSNEWPGVGMSVAPWMSDYSNGLMVEGNANMVRWMHVTPWKQDVESCDRVGLMQMFPAGDAEADVTGRRWEQRVKLMRDAIIYCRNNPSVLLYESGNESVSEVHMAEMKALRDQYDPHGGRAAGSREMLDSREAEYGGEMLYINHSARIPMIATEYCRDEALRKYWDDFTPPYHLDGVGPLYRNADASPYNRNQDSFAKEEVIRWNDYYVSRPGTGKRVSSGGLNIVFSDTNTHCRGEENYRRSGETDAMRILKDAYLAHQVMWDGWVDIENYRTYIIGHWNYAPKTIKDVMVVSPSDKVELFLNGKSLGFGEKTYNFLHTFKQVRFEGGELKAVSQTARGKIQSEDIRKTTGKPVALRLKLIDRPTPVKADGADMVLVEVEVVDARGMRCPDVHPLVNFSVDGPAEWRGGIGQGPENHVLSTTLPAECGVNRAILRSTTRAGKVQVQATSAGLTPATLSYETEAFRTEGGLSTMHPAAGLPSLLKRGPTPEKPSFKISRKTLTISGVKAAVNQEKAAQSYDDNELTEWSNDGKIATGWIQYQFTKKTTVDEVCLKLTGWRSRSYPLEILVDDKIVWKGETARSLGYITLSFKPAKGKTLTIRLTGSGKEQDAFQNMVELNGNKELDGFRDPKGMNNSGQLRIIETELYSTIKN